jgi:hypothetical protein
MPINEVILQLIDSLGALGGIVGGAHAAQQMTQARRAEIATEVVSAARLGVIDEELLGNISNKVKEAVKRLADAYGDRGNSDQALEEEKKIAQHKVCKYLKDIRFFNQGTLPKIPKLSDYLNEQWQSFGCTGTK